MRIGVDLGSRSYEVILNSDFADLGCSLQDAVGPAPRVVIVSCETVWTLYADDVLNALSTVGVEPEVILVEEGESAKSMTVWSGLVNSILSLGIDRSTVVVSVGGGVIGDLAGFAAATSPSAAKDASVRSQKPIAPHPITEWTSSAPKCMARCFWAACSCIVRSPYTLWATAMNT